jgi:hypothetical protein
VLLTMMQFMLDVPRFLFLTGKGGVGKTSVACATAVQLSDAGKQVLLVSTDPASNIGQVFGRAIGAVITAIPEVPGLAALEIDPERAAEAYRERIIAPVRGLLPERDITSITEQLSGSCTTEIASFNEFTALLSDQGAVGGYDHVIFDTAPTGHDSTVAVAGLLDGLSQCRQRRRVLLRPTCWSRQATQHLRGRSRGAQGPQTDSSHPCCSRPDLVAG